MAWVSERISLTKGLSVDRSLLSDEGHFQKLLDNEVQALKNACLGKQREIVVRSFIRRMI